MNMPISKAAISILVASSSIPLALVEGITKSDVTSLVTQVPIVAGFIIFILAWNEQAAKGAKDRDKLWQNFYEDQRKEDRKSMESITKEFSSFRKTISKCPANSRNQSAKRS
jgi:hypothetical protein